MVQYSGPDSQEVLDRFNIDWVDYLTTLDYIVVAVDGRGTGARGQEFRKCTYMNLGIKESDDQIAAARYFGTLPYIDAANIYRHFLREHLKAVHIVALFLKFHTRTFQE